MSAVKTPTSRAAVRAPNTKRFSREELATNLLPLLGDEPISQSNLGKRVFESMGLDKPIDSSTVAQALEVLKARDQARRVSAGLWVAVDSSYDSPLPEPQTVTFPYEAVTVRADTMFVDESYQRPLTQFKDQIVRNFDPFLFGTVSLSDRGTKAGQKRYALIDGQTRWVAATDLGIIEIPALIFRGLSVADEARIFARLQKNRRGVGPWFRFRAEMVEGRQEAIELHKLVSSTGYNMGVGSNDLNTIVALEVCYERDPFELQRTLLAYREAFPDERPGATHIKGLHYWFWDPDGKHHKGDKSNINDERLVRCLQSLGLNRMRQKAASAKELGMSGRPEKFMAQIIDKAYRQPNAK